MHPALCGLVRVFTANTRPMRGQGWWPRRFGPTIMTGGGRVVGGALPNYRTWSRCCLHRSPPVAAVHGLPLLVIAWHCTVGSCT